MNANRKNGEVKAEVKGQAGHMSEVTSLCAMTRPRLSTRTFVVTMSGMFEYEKPIVCRNVLHWFFKQAVIKTCVNSLAQEPLYG